MCFDAAFSCSRRSSDVNSDPMHKIRLKRKLRLTLFQRFCIRCCFFWFLWARHFIFAESKDWPLDGVIINAAVSSCEKGWQWETWLSLNVVLWGWIGSMVCFEACWGMVALFCLFCVCVYVYIFMSVFYVFNIVFFKTQQKETKKAPPSFPSEDRCLAFLRENLASDAVTFGAAAEACSSAMRWTEALAMAAAAPSVVTSKAALFVAWMQWKKWRNQWRNIRICLLIQKIFDTWYDNRRWNRKRWCSRKNWKTKGKTSK